MRQGGYADRACRRRRSWDGRDPVLARSDVSHASDVDELADVTYRTFGECAGVAAAGPAWMATLDDWT